MITRVVVVEDQPRILEAQTALLSDVPDVEVVGQALSGETGLTAIARARPDVALVDLGLPGLDGVELTRRARASWPETEILVFTIYAEPERADAAVRAGAAGYVLKGTPLGRLVEAIRAVHAGGAVVEPSLARPLIQRAARTGGPVDPGESWAWTPLSRREIEVLQATAKGLSNVETARMLGLTQATVRTHLAHIFDKLDVKNRVEAVTEGIRRGIIQV